MKKKRSVFLQYLLLVSIFLLPTLIYGQTNPDITLSNSLDNDTVCQSTSFTLTVSDTQSDLTTYTLSYGTTQVVSSSTSGLISFTVTGLTSETVLTVVASNATGTDTSSITIYVPLLLSSGVISTTASSTLCYGGYINADIIGDGSSLSTSSATIDPGSSSASITYQWQFKTTSDDWANFTGASTSTNLTSSVLSGFPVFESTTIRRVAYATKDDVTCSVNITYTELSFTVSSVIDPIITSNTTDYNVCSDQSYNFTTSTISGITHRWYLGTTLVHTGDSYTLDAGTISTDSTLGLIASSASCSSTLVTATLKVAPLPIITISSGLVSDTFCARDEFTITVNDTQSSNSTYKLSYAGGSETKTSSTGAVTFTLKLASQGDISVTATSLTGCTDTVTKTIFIPKLLSPGTVTSTQGVLCYGETISANISSTSVATTTSDSSAASITYAWYYSTDNLVTWTSIGSNTTSLATNTLANLGGLVTDISFKREASVSRGGSVSCSPLSTYISFSVSSELVTPVINSPSTVCIASDNTFTVVDAGYDYTWSVATLSATGLNFVLNAGDLPKGDYVLSVYGETASCSTTVVTQTLIVTEAPVLTINTGLLDNAVCSGESFTITVSDTQIGSLTTYTLSAPGGPYVKSSSTGQVTFTLSVTSETDLSVTSVPTDGCGATVTQTISVPKIGTPGTVTSTQGVLCYGESLSANITNLTAATLDGDSSSASITYAWYFSTDSQITWNNIAGATSSTLATTTLSNSVGGVISNTTVRRDAYVIADGEDCSPLSTYISFSVSSELVTPVINSPSTVCIASDNTFTVVDAGYDYTWSVATLSATGLNFVLNAGDLPKGDYVLSVYGETASCSTTVVTQTLIVTEAPVLTINTGLLDNAVCSGESFTITVSDTQIGSLTTYTLSAPGGPYVKSSSTGQVTFTLSVTSETDLSVTSVPTDGCGATVTQTISVPKIGTPGTVTSTQGVLCYGESLSANITNLTAATLDGDSSSASITYAWYFSTDSQITWNNIAGATSSTLATTTLSNSVGGVISNTTVRRDAYVIADGEDCSPLSTYISFSVSSELVTPVINSPSTVCIASDNTFTVVDAGYDYTWSVATLSATGLNFVLNAGDLPKGDYVLSVYGETASCSTTVVTQTLIVTEAPVLTINTGLLDNAVCTGESFTITVSDTQIGSLTTYTLSAPGGPYVKSSSTGQVTFTLSVTSETDLSVTSVPTDGCGATVTQTISVPKIGTPGTVTSTQGVLCYGESLSANITNLTAATLDGDSSSASITYAWYFSTDSQITWNNIAGATSSTLATTTLSNSVGGVISNTTVRRDAYVIADGEDCSPLSTYISFSVSSELVTPVINSPSTVCIASDNTFTVVDAGYDYTWSVATLSATGLNFVLNAGDLPKGDYVLSVYGETASCSTTVVTQTLIVTEAPVLTINTGLLDNAVCTGESFTITVSDTQIGSLTTYTLSAPGGPYVKSSSTGQVTFTLSVTSETDLSVTSVPTDGCGATVTQTISVPKIGTPGTVTSTQGVLCYGESLSANITNLTAATLDGDSSSASITYAWYFSTDSQITWNNIAGATSSTLATTTLSNSVGGVISNTTVRRDAYVIADGEDCSPLSTYISFSVSSELVTPVINSPSTVCIASDNTFTVVDAGYDYTWSVATLSATGLNFVLNAGDLPKGDYVLSVYGETASCSTTVVTQTLIVTEAPVLTINTGLLDNAVCTGESFTITVSDTQIGSLTTYTLSAPGGPYVKSSSTGQVTFTLSVTSETDLSVTSVPTDGCGATVTQTISVPKIGTPGTVTSTQGVLCYGESLSANITNLTAATLDGDSSSASITYAWYFSTDSQITWNNIAGATSSTLATTTLSNSVGGVISNTTVRRDAYVIADGEDCSPLSTYISFSVSSELVTPVINSPSTVCIASDNTFTVVDAGYDYTWSVATLSATGLNFVLNAGDLPKGDYVLSVYGETASCSTTVVTQTLIVTEAPVLTINTGLLDNAVCSGESFTITVSDTQIGSLTTYTLSAPGGPYVKSSSTGQVTFTLSVTSETDLSVTSVPTDGCGATVTQTISVPKIGTPGTVTSTQGVLCYGESLSANITNLTAATLDGDSSSASITYAWYFSTDSQITWNNIAGATSSTLATTTLSNSVGGVISNTTVRRDAYVIADGEDCSPLSTYISFSVSSELVTPVINSPSTVCIASDNTFTVVDAGYDYTWSVATLSATGLNFVLNAGDLPKGDYVLSVYGETASCSTTVVTQTLIVTEAPVLTINTGLLDNAVCSGESFTITVSDTQIGSLTTYTLSAPGGPYVKSSSTGQVTFTLSVTSETDLSVTSVPTDGCGATVTQTISVPKIGTPGTVTSTQGVLCYGESLSANITNLTAATLDGDSSSASITYAWYFSTDSQITWNNIAGATSSTLATTTLSNSVGGVISNTTVRRDAYVIADGEDCSPLSTYISFSVSSELVTPVINSPSTVCIASDNTFTVVDAGYDYTWSVATLSATGLNFVLNAGDLPKGDYVLSVYGETASCSTTVVTQTLIVTEAPVLTINTGLLDNAVCSGESFTITVSDTQIGSLTTYTLSAPGGPYVKSSSTGQVTFTLSVTSETDLSVTSVPTDGCGATVTQTISVPKIGTPGTVTSTQGVLCYGESLSANITNLTAATLDGDSSSASITYAWYFSTDSQITWNNIAGATSSTLATTTLSNSVGGVISNTTVRRDAYVIADGEDCSPLSTYISFSVSSELVTPVINSPSTVCIASDNTFTVVDAGYDYTWSVATLSATGLNFVLNAGDLPKGDYVLSVYGETASCSTTVVTQTLIVTEAPVLTINTGLLDNAVCSGESFTITVSDTQIGSLTTYTLSAPGGPYVKSSSTGQVTFTLSVTSETDLSVTSVPTDGCGATVTQTISVPKIGTAGTYFNPGCFMLWGVFIGKHYKFNCSYFRWRQFFCFNYLPMVLQFSFYTIILGKYYRGC